MKQATAAAVLTLAVLAVALTARADTTTILYPPSDGGTAALPQLSGRKAVAVLNPYDVAICVTPANSSVCMPVVPGGQLNLEVSDSHPFKVRLCSGTTQASCLPSGDAGVVVLEVQ